MPEINGKILCDNCFAERTEHGAYCAVCGYGGGVVENTGALPPGTTLSGKYAVGKVLGRGGFGITYLAYDKINNHIVALKEYFPDSLSYRTPGESTISSYTTSDKKEYYQSGVEKFYGEAKVLSRFNGNEHIINVQDFFS